MRLSIKKAERTFNVELTETELSGLIKLIGATCQNDRVDYGLEYDTALKVGALWDVLNTEYQKLIQS